MILKTQFRWYQQTIFDTSRSGQSPVENRTMGQKAAAFTGVKEKKMRKMENI